MQSLSGVCSHCGTDLAEERTIRIRVDPRPGTALLCIVTDADTGKDVSGLVPVDPPGPTGLRGARPGDRIPARIYTSDPAHVVPGLAEICSQPAIYEVV